MISAMRVRSDANVATMMRPSACLNISSRFLSTVFSETEWPGFSAFGAVHHEGVHAHLADALELFEALRIALVVVVHAEVREVDDVADRGLQQHAGRFRNGVRHAEEERGEVVRNLYLVAAL